MYHTTTTLRIANKIVKTDTLCIRQMCVVCCLFKPHLPF